MTEKRDETEVAPSNNNSGTSSDYILGILEGIKDRQADSAARENKLIDISNTSTSLSRVLFGLWTAILLGILGINYWSGQKLDDAIRETKREVREIAGSIRPEKVDWGRVEPGDGDKLAVYFRIEEGDQGQAYLIGNMFPKIEVTGANGTISGWRYTYHDEMLDWITSTNEFRLDTASAQFLNTEEYRRAHMKFGEILWLDAHGGRKKLELIPGAPWAGRISLKISYRSCEQAFNAGLKLKELSKSGNLGEIGIMPIVENYPTSEKTFDVEVLFFPETDFKCWPESDSAPVDPTVYERSPKSQET